MNITHTVTDSTGRVILETNDYRLARRIARRRNPQNWQPWLVLLCIMAAMFAAWTAGS